MRVVFTVKQQVTCFIMLKSAFIKRRMVRIYISKAVLMALTFNSVAFVKIKIAPRSSAEGPKNNMYAGFFIMAIRYNRSPATIEQAKLLHRENPNTKSVIFTVIHRGVISMVGA